MFAARALTIQNHMSSVAVGAVLGLRRRLFVLFSNCAKGLRAGYSIVNLSKHVRLVHIHMCLPMPITHTDVIASRILPDRSNCSGTWDGYLGDNVCMYVCMYVCM